MSWIRGTVTDYLDLSDALVAAMTGSSLQTSAVNAGGTGYTVGDILTISGGTNTVAAQVEVLTAPGGVVGTVRRYNDGVYTVTPGTTAVAVTGGTGNDDCTLDLTWGSNGWTANRDTTWSGSDKEVLMEGEGGGSDEIFVGWRTYSDGPANRYNLELHGMTGYDSGLDFDEQAGISPGFHDDVLSTQKAGCYLLALNSSMSYWISVTSYRIVGVIKAGSSYFPFYMGWGNRFATASEYPYPMLIAGCTSQPDDDAAQSKLTSGLTDPWRDTSSGGTAQGPSLVFFTDNAWHGVANSTVGSSSRSNLGDRVVLPAGRSDGEDSGESASLFTDDYGNFGEFIEQNSLSGNAAANLHATPGTADQREMIPTVIVFFTPSVQVVMEIDDVWWVSAFGGVSAEDRFIENGEVYRVFQNGNRSDLYAHFALKEV